jgi:hypothetical protein
MFTGPADPGDSETAPPYGDGAPACCDDTQPASANVPARSANVRPIHRVI